MEEIVRAYARMSGAKAKFFSAIGIAFWFFGCCIAARSTEFPFAVWVIGSVVLAVLPQFVFRNKKQARRGIRKAVRGCYATEFEAMIDHEMQEAGIVRYKGANLWLWITRTWFVLVSGYGSIVLKRRDIVSLDQKLMNDSRYGLVIEYKSGKTITIRCLGDDAEEVIRHSRVRRC